MLDIATNYYPAFENIEQEQLEGRDEQMNGIYYQILGMQELLTVQNSLKEQLELPTNEELTIDPQFEYSYNGFIGNQFYDDRVSETEETTQDVESTTSWLEYIRNYRKEKDRIFLILLFFFATYPHIEGYENVSRRFIFMVGGIDCFIWFFVQGT